MIKFVENIRMVHKLLALVSALLIPLALMAFAHYRQLHAILDVGERQLAILPIFNQLMTLQVSMQKHRDLIPISLLGNEVTDQQIDESWYGAVTAFEGLKRSVERMNLETDDWPLLASRFATFFSVADGRKLKGFEDYTDLGLGVARYSQALGIQSELNSGIETDQVLLNQIISILSHASLRHIGFITAFSTYKVTVSEMTNSDLKVLSMRMALAEDSFRELGVAVLRVAGNRVESETGLPQQMKVLDADFERFRDLIDSVIQEKPVDAAAIFSLGSEITLNLQKLFNMAFPLATFRVSEKLATASAAIRTTIAIGLLSLTLSCLVILVITISIVNSFRQLVDTTESITSGSREVEFPFAGKDEIGTLNRALRRLYDTMCRAESVASNELRRKDFLATLGHKLQADLAPNDLAETLLSCLECELGAAYGAVYRLDDHQNAMGFLSGYGVDETMRDEISLVSNAGLVSQCVKSRKSIFLEEVPENSARPIRSALVKISPKTIFLAPIVAEGDVLGVVELGFLNKPSKGERQLFEESREVIGTRFNSSFKRQQMVQLLKKTQAQSNELKLRQEELQTLNVDLEEKSQELEAQQEQLERVNLDLEAQQSMLNDKNMAFEVANSELMITKASLETKALDLERASKYKSEFLANMSHELRSPLNSILILSEIMGRNESGRLQPKEVEFAKTINASGSDLLNLIQDILDLAKVEAGKLELRTETIEVKGLLDSMDAQFKSVVARKGISFLTEIAPEAASVIVSDRQRLEQILRNFISNAAKFTDQGSVTLKVFPAANEQISFQVIDTGIGIRTEHQEAVFQAFYQIDSGASRRYAGTGLGLSISRSLADLLDGSISMTSEFGKGSVFTLTIPTRHKLALPTLEVAVQMIAVGESMPLDQQWPVAVGRPSLKLVSDDTGAGIEKSDRTLVIVEDDLKFANILSEQAQAKGFKVIYAESGEAGIEAVFKYLPSAVMLDVKLPGISGLAVLNRLKGDSRTSHIPIHVLSTEDYRLEALRRGADGFAMKPLRQAEMNAIFSSVDARMPGIRRVLIVEDNEQERRSIETLVGHKDLVVIGVATGEEAVRRFSSETFDCVILDLQLPDITGLKVLEIFRSHEDKRLTPIIIFTGKELSALELENLERFADSVIIKGIKSPKRLLDETAIFLHRVNADLPPEHRKLVDETKHRKDSFEDRVILLVDDDVRNIFSTMAVLEGKGFKVHTASNGKEAIARLNEVVGIDLVLMDMMMPEMDGYEATRTIRTDQKFAKLPIIAFTAKAMKGDRERCLEAGANDYLTKPLNVDQMFALLYVWLA